MKHSIFSIKSAKIAVCLLAVPLFFSCSKDDEHYKVTTDKATVVLTEEMNSQTFNITSEGEWRLEAEGLNPGYGTVVGNAGWYKVDQMYGKGNATVTITLNEVEPENRNTTLTVIGKHNKVNIGLKQQITGN